MKLKNNIYITTFGALAISVLCCCLLYTCANDAVQTFFKNFTDLFSLISLAVAYGFFCIAFPSMIFKYRFWGAFSNLLMFAAYYDFVYFGHFDPIGFNIARIIYTLSTVYILYSMDRDKKVGVK